MNSDRLPPRRDSSSFRSDQGASRPRWRRVVGGALLVAVVAGLGYVIFRPTTRQMPPMGAFGSMAMPVGVATASKADVDIQLSALGTVTPLATVTVRTQIAGQLMSLGFREGQTVKAGDFLAQVDPRPYQMQLDQYLGQLARDQALLKDAQINLARYEKLLAEDSIARQQRDTQASLVKQYEGAVATDQAQVNNARLNVAYCRIVSPITGRVGLRQVDVGNYIQTSDTNGIVVVTQMQPITAVFSVPEDNLPTILRRMRDGATLAVEAYDRGHITKLADGHVTTVDNQIDTTTGTVKMRAEFDNKDETLFPNQFVNVRMKVDTVHDATVIPSAAIQRSESGTFVYLVKTDNTVTVRPVSVGPITGTEISVQSGLNPGDVVVVDGADKLREGAQITIPAAQGTSEATPSPASPADGAKETHGRRRSE